MIEQQWGVMDKFGVVTVAPRGQEQASLWASANAGDILVKQTSEGWVAG